MIPHAFCSPEFVLEVPVTTMPNMVVEDHNNINSSNSDSIPLQPSVLLEIQTELYGFLSTRLRYKLHQTYLPKPKPHLPPPPTTTTAQPPAVAYCSVAAHPDYLRRTIQHVRRTGVGLTDPSRLPPLPPLDPAMTVSSSLASQGASASSPPPPHNNHHNNSHNSHPPPAPQGLVFVSETRDRVPAPLYFGGGQPQQKQEQEQEQERERNEEVNLSALGTPQGKDPSASVTDAELAYVAYAFWAQNRLRLPELMQAAVGGRAALTAAGVTFYNVEEESVIRERHLCKHVYRKLYITDSRVAAELSLLCLKRGGIALPHQAKLYGIHVLPKRVQMTLKSLSASAEHSTSAAAPNATTSTSSDAPVKSLLTRLIKADPEEKLKKLEALRDRYNLDGDLHDALTDGWRSPSSSVAEAFKQSGGGGGPREAMQRLHDAIVTEQEKQYGIQSKASSSSSSSSSSLLLSASAMHERHVMCCLRFAEHFVRYAAVLNESEESSPFLLAMGLFFATCLPTLPFTGLAPDDTLVTMPLRAEDTLIHFLHHPRRTIQALGLYVMRYVVPPEELPLYFFLALGEEVVVTVTAESSSAAASGGSLALQTLAQQLLLDDEVCEAWLPRMDPLWLEQVCRPAATHITAFWQDRKRAFMEQQQQSPPQHRSTTTDGSNGAWSALQELHHLNAAEAEKSNHRTDEEPHSGSGTGTATTTRGLVGKGKGVGAHGFRSIAELAKFAQSAGRRSKAQSIITLLASRREVVVAGGASSRARKRLRGGAANDADDAEDESEDIAGGGGGESSRHPQNHLLPDKRGRVGPALSGDPYMNNDVDMMDAAEEEDNNDGFLLRVQTAGEDNADHLQQIRRQHQYAGGGVVSGGGSGPSPSSSSPPAKEGPHHRNNRDSAAASAAMSPMSQLHREVREEGYRVLLSLLGRTRPFDPRDEHRIDF